MPSDYNFALAEVFPGERQRFARHLIEQGLSGGGSRSSGAQSFEPRVEAAPAPS